MYVAVEVKIESKWERLAVADTTLEAAMQEAPTIVKSVTGKDLPYNVRRIQKSEIDEGVALARTNDEVPLCMCGRQRCVINPKTLEWECEHCDDEETVP